jgi:hypothetical protein
MDKISRDRRVHQLSDEHLQTLKRIEQHLARLVTMLDEGFGAHLRARFPYGDGKAADRWGHRRG